MPNAVSSSFEKTIKTVLLGIGLKPENPIEFVKKHPWLLTAKIEQLVRQSVRAYEQMDQTNYERLTDLVYDIADMIGVKVHWPGLYPSWRYKKCPETGELSVLWKDMGFKI